MALAVFGDMDGDGDGGGLVALAADLAAGRLVRLFSLALPDLFAYYIVTAPGALERPKVRAFRDWLRREADA